MTNQRIFEIMKDCPVIAAVRDQEGLMLALRSGSPVVFILYGDLCTVRETVEKVHKEGKLAIVCLDQIIGLAAKEAAVDFLKSDSGADGILSSRLPLIRRAKELGMATVLRVSAEDSAALEDLREQCRDCRPDFVEILSWQSLEIIEEAARSLSAPVIAGGLFSEKSEMTAALAAGAVSVSAAEERAWFL